MLAVVSGIIAALGGALQIASSFKRSTETHTTGTGSGTGFWKYFSNTDIGTMAISAANVGPYITRMTEMIVRDTNSNIQKNLQNIVDDLNEIKYFESYNYGDCDNMVNSVSYNRNKGSLFLYIYTFTPFIKGGKEAVRIQTLKCTVNLKLASDFLVVSKLKTSFMKCTMSQEIQYIPRKGIDSKAIVDSISIAMAPAVLGLVKVPERFMNIMKSLLKQQMERPDKSIITAPTAEQTKAALERFEEMVKVQANYEKNAKEGFKNISDEIKKLGDKGKEDQPITG
jgi:hypothetical protein